MNWESGIIGTPSMAGLHASHGGRDAFITSPTAGWDHIPALVLGNNSHHATPINNAPLDLRTSKTVTLMDRVLVITEQSSTSGSSAAREPPMMTQYAMARAWVRNDADIEPHLPSSSSEPCYTTAALPPPPPSPGPAQSVLSSNGATVDLPNKLPPQDLFAQSKQHWLNVKAYHSEIDRARQARHLSSAKFQL